MFIFIMSFIEGITSDIINKVIIELKKDKNKYKLENEIIYPIVKYITNSINEHIFPYIAFMFTVFILILVIVSAILLFLLFL